MATAVVNSKSPQADFERWQLLSVFYVHQIIMYVNSRTDSTVNIVPALNRPISIKISTRKYGIVNLRPSAASRQSLWFLITRPVMHQLRD